MLKEVFHDSFDNFEITRICMENSCKRDWMTKVVFLIQMLLTFGGRCNRYFWDIRLKILRFPNFYMLFQLALTKFFKTELFSCLPKVDHVIKSGKEPINTLYHLNFHFFFSVILSQFAVFLLRIPDFYWFRCTWDPTVLTGLLLYCGVAFISVFAIHPLSIVMPS